MKVLFDSDDCSDVIPDNMMAKPARNIIANVHHRGFRNCNLHPNLLLIRAPKLLSPSSCNELAVEGIDRGTGGNSCTGSATRSSYSRDLVRRDSISHYIANPLLLADGLEHNTDTIAERKSPLTCNAMPMEVENEKSRNMLLSMVGRY